VADDIFVIEAPGSRNPLSGGRRWSALGATGPTGLSNRRLDRRVARGVS
jgi:hypothetical protein